MATAKQRTTWHCIECGLVQVKWAGQCSQCHQWNTFKEEIAFAEKGVRYAAANGSVPSQQRPLCISEVSMQPPRRLQTLMPECDRLLGGGIVPGSLTLVGGEPGIGKSTLLLQLAHHISKQGKIVLYLCGEESPEQTALRARRLKIESKNIFLLCETEVSIIKQQIEQIKPDFFIVDSIQITYKAEIPSAPGSVSQVRECAMEFLHLAKRRGMATFLIGHVTKSGEIAGPRVLEHLVDTVLYFEGDRQHNYRMIRVVKNRFGPNDEVAVFQMLTEGLVEVPNPSQIFLEERRSHVVGSTVIPTLEGSRPILVEAQALVTETAFATPSRRCTGLEQNRLALLVAVLEKRMGYRMFCCDIFASIAGGVRLAEPGGDLGMLVALASSTANRIVDGKSAVFGEVGLGGEVRSVARAESRIKEAIHLGFERCVLPARNLKGISEELRKKIELIPVEVIDEAVNALLV